MSAETGCLSQVKIRVVCVAMTLCNKGGPAGVQQTWLCQQQTFVMRAMTDSRLHASIHVLRSLIALFH
jgi:hypothetical protein